MNKVIWNTCWLCVAVSATGLAATIENGGFETGNFSGWTLQMVKSLPGSANHGTPTGWAAVDSWLPGPILPESGHYFAALSIGNPPTFGGRAGAPSTVDLRQILSLQKGDVVSGWALISKPETLISARHDENAVGEFCSPSCSQPAQESAWVEILDGSGPKIANPWDAVLVDRPKAPVCSVKTGTWEFWQWQAPAAGSYTLKLGSTAGKLAPFSDETCFDGIQVHSIPEPNALGLLVIGFGLFAAARLRRS
ncbi:MAG: PEP-CTERM sorting domain-containing protein [Verrucomicrobiota bacterium]|jgi:hypothetical protein